MARNQSEKNPLRRLGAPPPLWPILEDDAKHCLDMQYTPWEVRSRKRTSWSNKGSDHLLDTRLNRHWSKWCRYLDTETNDGADMFIAHVTAALMEHFLATQSKREKAKSA